MKNFDKHISDLHHIQVDFDGWCYNVIFGKYIAEKLITAIEVMPKDTKWYSFGMKTSYGKNGEKYVASNLYGENNAGDKCIIIGMRFMENETEKPI